MRERTENIVRRLADRAEEVCRHYLSKGRKVGGYWVVGDRRNNKGRSLFVRLSPNGSMAAGKWNDPAVGQHGDLLDIIASAIGAQQHQDTLAEAERFLGVAQRHRHSPPQRRSTVEAAQRLFFAGGPVAGTIAERYLASRGIYVDGALVAESLRFYPHCYYRPPNGAREEWPALLAAVTNNRGTITGVLRTYLSRDGTTKAPIDLPRRALGQLTGHGVRFGPPAEIMAVGEGIETVLSLSMAMPRMSMVAPLSAAHLGAWIPPPHLRRVYIAVDRDDAGRGAAARLREPLDDIAIEALELHPRREDFNDDLIGDGVTMLRALIADQLHPDDRNQFIETVIR